MSDKDKQIEPDKSDKAKRDKRKRKLRIHTTENPFTLHIDDTPENVARALFGKPLSR